MRVLVTGATRGLGLAAATTLAARGADVVVSGRDRAAVERVAAQIGGTPLLLDLEDADGVRAVAAEMDVPDAVVANAGVQFSSAPTFNAAGVERTHAINVLGHVVLVETLLARATTPSRVVLLGSGTHDPAQRTMIPPADETLDVDAIAGGSIANGRQRYSTSKLHCTALAPAWARQHPEILWSTFDPGLMVGTGLVRDYPAWLQRVFGGLSPLLARTPGASTTQRSADALARLVLDDPSPFGPGEIVDFTYAPARRSTRASEIAYQDGLLAALRRQADVTATA